MPRKLSLFLLVLTTLMIVAALVIRNGKPPGYKKGSSIVFDSAVSAALSLYKKEVLAGRDMSSGSCLSNDLMPGWVVDIVHSPREAVDDLPENQCQAFREGRASHFVELDTNGNLVRVY